MLRIVGHSGGFSWDEALFFAVPVVVFGVLQYLGRRRARNEDGRDAAKDD